MAIELISQAIEQKTEREKNENETVLTMCLNLM